MIKEKKEGTNDLFDLFEDILSPSEVLSSKMKAQVSAAITKERLKLGMTQEEFADFIGATQSQISRWEHGGYNFSIEKIADISAKLNLDVNFSFVNMDTYAQLGSYNMYNVEEKNKNKSTCLSEPQPYKIRLFRHDLSEDKSQNYITSSFHQNLLKSEEDKTYVAIC